MRIVLLGDSHLARVRRNLTVVGPDVRNAAEGGASALDLVAQATRSDVGEADVVVVSVGTNDAAPWRQVCVRVFARALSDFLQSAPARRCVYVAPPGVDESRLPASGDRTNAVLDEYRNAAVSICHDAGAPVIRTERLVEPLGAGAFVSDGLHLSGAAYKVVLPAIAAAVRGGALTSSRP
jgi:lysophospholipase L1-like esterase